MTKPFFVDEPVDFVYHFASPASPDRLPAAAAAHAQGRLVRHAQRARAGEGASGAVPDRLDRRGLRRSAGASAAGVVLGQREPDRAARRLRRGQAVRRGADDGLPPPAGRGHGIVRIFNTYGPRMRPHDGRAIPTFMRQALQDKPITVFGDGSQTRSFCYVDDLVDGHHPARRVRRPPAGEHRQPERVHAAGAGRGRPRGHRLALGDRLRGAADGRSEGAPAGHHARAASCSAGSRPSSSGRVCAGRSKPPVWLLSPAIASDRAQG